MSATRSRPRVTLHRRVHAGMKQPTNWLQLLRFAIVGGSGYLVNLAVFWVCTHPLGVDYRVAAVIAFAFAVTNNFGWNRHWTFAARDGHAGFQGVRFLGVSLLALAFNLAVLELLVSVLGAPVVAAQAIAVASAMPIGFLGNKLWTFRAAG